MVARLISQSVLPLAALLTLCGCSENIADMTCDDVEDRAIGISKGSLIKITDARETSRTDAELVCHGVGFYRDGSQTPTRYRAWRDEDDEIMIAWDTKEAEDSAWA